MIQINLLPQNARKSMGGGKAMAARSSGGHTAIWIAVLLVVLVDGGASWLAMSNVWAARNDCEIVKMSCDSVSREIKSKLNDAENIRKFREVVSNQMDVLKSLDPPDRILWSEKLNLLSNLMPANVFLAEMQVTENVQMVETEQSRQAHERWQKADAQKRGKEPETVKRPRIHYIMRLTGMSTGGDSAEQGANMLKFHKAMTSYEISDGHGGTRRFMDGFTPNIEFESLEAVTHEGQPVTKFIFKLTTKASGEGMQKAPDAQKPKQVAANFGN